MQTSSQYKIPALFMVSPKLMTVFGNGRPGCDVPQTIISLGEAMNKAKIPIVFLPGWGFDVLIWETIASNINHYPCILYNLPQMNDCKKISNSSLRQVIECINHHLPNECILVAWSLSGLIAAGLSSLYPSKVKKIILVANTAKFTASETWLGANKKTVNRFYKKALHHWSVLHQQFVRLTSSPNKDIHTYNQLLKYSLDISHHSSSLFYLDMLLQTDALPLYHSLSIPCLQIFGDQDLVLPFSCAQQMIAEYPQYFSYIIRGAGHAPFLTHTNEFLQSVISFIESP